MFKPKKELDTQEKESKKKDIILFKRVSAKERIFFIQNIKTMIISGLSLTESLDTLSNQIKNPYFKKILLEISIQIEQGQQFSQAISKYPKVFPEIFINMISAGELSGNLENILEQLYLQAKKDHDLISKIRGAMTYPAVVLFAMIVMGIGMMVFVFPTFIDIFEEANAELPTITNFLISTSEFITENGIIASIILIIFIVAFIRALKTTVGKKIFDLFLLKIFIIGPIVQKVNLARFARSLSSLLKTDIALIKSFEIASSVVGNYYYKNAIFSSVDELKKGSSISQTLKAYPKLFPPMILQMIMVGEKSGTTDELLNEIAIYYEDEVDNITKNLSSIIEPLLILFIGAAVGLMAVSVMMPMYNLAQQY